MLEVPNKLAPFECHGVIFKKRSKNNLIGDCPFCLKKDHFYANEKTGQWDCKRCGQKGNLYSFLQLVAVTYNRETEKEEFKELSKLRQLPIKAFRQAELGWDGMQWLIPIRNENGTVIDIRRWIKGTRRTLSTTGCKAGLFGVEKLKHNKKGKIWICEGEWDAMALNYVFHKAKVDDMAVGTPGANTFKDDWTENFLGRSVIIAYDNDDPGDDGSLKVAKALDGYVQKLHFVHWPDTRPKGYDVRDYIIRCLKKKMEAKKVLKSLSKIIYNTHRRDSFIGSTLEEDANWPIKVGSVKRRIKWPELVKEFRSMISMTEDMVTTLRLACITLLASHLSSDPIWMYIVGPPGCGKTLLLQATQGSERTVFRSTVTPKSLCSGFHMPKGGDPSLLPQLKGKCAVFKDWTEILTSPITQREEIYGVLRGAFDGHVIKTFGNGVHRDYKGKFSMLAGVTAAIHADQQSHLGERFVKFEMYKGKICDSDMMIQSAINSLSQENEFERRMQELVGEFCSLDFHECDLPGIPNWMRNSLSALCQVTSSLRASVDREKFGGREIKYRPSGEIGTRLAKSFMRIAQVDSHMREKKEVDEEAYELLKRLAMDSCIGFNIEIVEAVMALGGKARRTEIGTYTGIPTSTLIRRVTDLQLLGVLKRARKPKEDVLPSLVRAGRKAYVWIVDKEIRRFWKAAGLKTGKEIKRNGQVY